MLNGVWEAGSILNSWWKKVGLPRQEVAFWEKGRKIKACGSLREDFYTRFIPEN